MTDRSNPHAIVEVEGQVWDSWLHPHLFSRVSVDLTTDQASEGLWQVFDPDFKFIDKYSRADGVPLVGMRLWLGYGENLGEPVFKGLLARVERGSVNTTFRAYDMGFKMRQQKRTGYGKGTDLKIMRKLTERNGLKFQGPAKGFPGETHKSMMQDEQTDWEHVSELARDAGLVLYVRGDTLFAQEPAKVGTPVASFAFRKDFVLLKDFDLAHKLPENKGGRPKHIEVRGRGHGGKRLSGKSDENKRGHTTVEIKKDLPVKTQRAANRRAEAKKALEREHAFECRISALSALDGRRADVRDTIKLENIGKLFSGLYLVDSVSHELSATSGLKTTFSLYRDIKAG